jgi:hypothetical protein
VPGRFELTVPSTELGYVLAQRIGIGAEVVLDNERSRWFVALREVSSDELIALLSVVGGWLRDERLAHAEVCLDGRSYLLDCGYQRRRSGAEYDLSPMAVWSVEPG